MEEKTVLVLLKPFALENLITKIFKICNASITKIMNEKLKTVQIQACFSFSHELAWPRGSEKTLWPFFQTTFQRQ